MGKSWEEMCQELVVDGRPGDVASAALGWEQLLKNLRSVQESLERDIDDLGTVWKGPAYREFKKHVESIAKDIERTVSDAEKDNGIVHSLNDAADKLSKAQAEFPIPASCVNDILEARNGRVKISAGFFEMSVAPDFLGWFDPVTSLSDWLFDKTEDAAKVYNRAGNDYIDTAVEMPGEAANADIRVPGIGTPDINGGGGGAAGPGSVPNIGGPGPTGSGPGTLGPIGGAQEFPKSPKDGLGPLGEGPGYETPGLGENPGYTPPENEYGTGLAGATPSLGGGLSGGGLGGAGGGLGGGAGPGGGGLGSGGGLGGGGGAGVIAGGGSLGRPVSPSMGMMGGGAGAGAGRGGGGARGGGRGPGAGVGGAGGMVGGAGGAGTRGAGARGAGAGGAGAGGAGARGAAAGAMGGRGGMVGGMGSSAGYGGGEDVADRSSWLEEDEDVWGGGDGAPPGVLR